MPLGSSSSFLSQCFQVVNVQRPVGDFFPSLTHCGISYTPISFTPS